ncbi:cation diffusion facilitator family transporter [Neobacillus thermocopriae]|uniref:Cation transporter n=1 Tax=Neobacillus thermocopriae TaxID=1215031 RepID=A0A6B3TS09_9BACI|nr:cation diffusion facilitator family transporter [Neobacillus thermocopriae]MED3624531.1 cation diffusion facilitator family transporter [Neobacillus thermocopriae]MED3712924.1 cation diffusion facilitator family transporter [Neobacillus thermocopriae]NEX79149.1 cation transporter [Neobacillus thermocopriae]
MGARESLAKKIAWISVVSNIILTLGKMIIGWYGNSDAVFADGIHSAADVVASVIVLSVIKIANKPADEEHPYGHGKAEVIVSGVVGILLFLVSIYVIYEGIVGFIHPFESPTMLTMWVALFSYVSKVILYRSSLRVARQHNSKAIEAIAFDHKADIAASMAAAIGVLLSLAGERFDIGFLLYGDKVASIFVAYLIFKIAKEMLTEAFDILLERNINHETLQEYITIINKFPEVRRLDRIRAREHGHYVLVDLRISIDHFKTIKEGHDLAKAIKEKLMDEYDNIEEVLIHLNPYFPENE